ncbi:MAG: glycosyltransferase family 25 protein [Candidatus Colwellbacteria bacterium]|nr:glycosyltransferase family 25 protein [Candidatus Colwellbacteria bacterium]
MAKTFEQIEIIPTSEEILRSCRMKSDTDSLTIGYTLGRLAESTSSKVFSPIMSDEFAIICYRMGDYNRTFDYVAQALKNNTWNESECDRLRGNMGMAAKHIIDRYTEYNPEITGKLYSQLYKKRMLKDESKRITVTMTMCKRYDLFRKTVSSFINCCEDIDLIDEWIVVDDNSSSADRNRALIEFPFIKFIWKGETDKGHPRSMNIISKTIRTPYLFHIEDDWIFYRKERYLSICLDIIESNPSYGQCLLNRSYGERDKCHDIACPFPMKFSKEKHRYYEHAYFTGSEMDKFNATGPKKHCAYWPHYSLRVGLTKKEVFDKIGSFNETTGHFEMEYAHRYVSGGYRTVFMDNIYCYHSGRCTFERDSGLKNAYELNDENQFSKPNESNLKRNKKLSLTEDEEKIPLYTIPEESDVKYKTKTYVMNLEKRPDRMKQFIVDNHENVESLQYRFFKGIDGQLITPLPKTLKLFETGDYTYRKGIMGCASSHIKIWHELIISELDVMIVLEDDITLAPQFVDKLIFALKSLPPKEWDILFLGHFLYPHLRKETDREDKLPSTEKWTRQQCIERSMGGTIGYAIHKRGAMKMFNHIQENGMYNAVDWVMFKNADKANIFYCYPHIVFSECVTNTIKPDSDIQYDTSSLCYDDEKRFNLEISYWRNRGVIPVVINDDQIPSRDLLLSHVHFIKTEKYLDVIKSLQYFPLEFYTLKGKYVVSIPHTKLDSTVSEEVILDGSYLNVNNPV